MLNATLIRRVAAVCAVAVVLPVAAAARVELRETGSTLLYPVLNAWVAAFGRTAGDVSITTEASGSGAGIAEAGSGKVQLGTSDAFLDDAQIAGGLVNIPLAVSAQFIGYHVSGIPAEPALRLSAALLAAMYDGTLTTWDDPRIAAVNPELRGKLPHKAIVPIIRSDRSGDTFLFTSYLHAQDPAGWKTAAATTLKWPAVAGEQSAKGNAGLLQLLGAIDGSVAYVGITYLEQASREGIGAAALRNHAGRYAAPTADAISSAVLHAGNVPRDARVSLIDLPGDATYPIVNFGYAIVKKQQSPDVAASLKKFLSWIVDPAGGNSAAMLGPVHFAPLPDKVRTVAKSLIDDIK